jgi:sporulation protein YlmC with PRC-barrel domain
MDAAAPEVTAADMLEGERVESRRGEELGSIAEIMLDVQRGTIAYAVLSREGFPGAGDHLFPIPWSALTRDADRRCFVLDADRETLERAPGFDTAHWPSMADASWAIRVHEFYGVRPYWTAASPRVGAGGAAGSLGL